MRAVCSSLLLLAFGVVHSYGQDAQWEMRMTPQYAVMQPGEVINITCQADVELAECGFKTYWDPYTDLSTDLPIARYTQGRAFSYTALEQGAGALRRGRCAIQFTAGEETNVQNVGCRGRTSTGPWKYDYLTLAVDKRVGFPMTITPRHPPYVLLGQELILLCKADRPLQWCHFHVPSERKKTWHMFSRGESTTIDSDKIEFYGAGLSRGECGIRVFQMGVNDTEWFVCTASAGGDTYSHRTTLIPVAKPPSRGPELKVRSNVLKADETLSAECSVSESRPPANITWYFGDRVVEGVEVPPEEFLWSIRLQGRKQTFSKTVAANDNGKTLKCVVTHVAMTSSLEAAKRITVGDSQDTSSSSATTCAPLRDPAVELTCSKAGTVLPCDQPAPPGTTAFMKCREGYVHSHYPGYRSISCTARGAWSRPVFKCIPDCGKQNSVGGVGFVANGEVAKAGEFPWHVGVYKKSAKNKNKQICGGTLVTPTVIITAAHCFWDNSRKRSEDKSRYLIAAGKFYREWDAAEEVDDTEVQRRSVRDLHIHERFLGTTRLLAADIALVVVNEAVVITRTVNVVCVDWQGDLEPTHLVEGNNGTVAGWGVTEKNSASDVLQFVRLPFVAFSRCKDVVSSAFLPFLTSDKLCAGWVNRSTAVCPGDSGGGLVFPQATPAGSRFYLQGLVSAGQAASETGVKCDVQAVTSFTKVLFYREWIEGIVFGQDSGSRK